MSITLKGELVIKIQGTLDISLMPTKKTSSTSPPPPDVRPDNTEHISDSESTSDPTDPTPFVQELSNYCRSSIMGLRKDVAALGDKMRAWEERKRLKKVRKHQGK